MRGNPKFTIAETKAEPSEQTIGYCVGIGYSLEAILAHDNLPVAVIAEVLKIAEATGAIKLIAQRERDKLRLEG